MSYKVVLLTISSIIFVGCSLFPSQQETTTPITTNKISESLISPTSIPEPTSSTEPEATDSATTKSYDLTEIAKHVQPTDCWFAVEGKVYDVTPFIASQKHPGKDAILQGCGKDATELFNTRPMGSGTPHSDKARSMITNFYIGELTK